jgi:hypothetical protein
MTKLYGSTGVKYKSTPNEFEIYRFDEDTAGFLCTGFSIFDTPCSAYTRTLILPRTLPSGSVVNAFAMDILTGVCVPSEVIVVTVVTSVGTKTFQVGCDDIVDGGVGFISRNVIKSINFTTTFDNYLVTALGLGSTKCNKGSKGSKGSRGSKGRGNRV